MISVQTAPQNPSAMKRKFKQFHQYKQNEKITFSLNTKKTKTCDIGNPGPVL